MQEFDKYYALEIYFEKHTLSYIFFIPVSKCNFVFQQYICLMNTLNIQTEHLSPSRHERIFFNPICKAPFSLQHIAGTIHFMVQTLQLHTRFFFYTLHNQKNLIWPYSISARDMDIEYIESCENCNPTFIFQTWINTAVRIKPV
jgi:hypothetical protein